MRAFSFSGLEKSQPGVPPCVRSSASSTCAPGADLHAAAPARAVAVRAAAPSRSRLVRRACRTARAAGARAPGHRRSGRRRAAAASRPTARWCWRSTARSTTIANWSTALAAAVRVPDRLGLRGDQRAVPRTRRRPASAKLNGIFAFALWDAAKGAFVIARDPLGVCPLYWGHDGDGRLWVASEMKALVRVCDDVAAFPPGHYYDSATGELRPLLRHAPWRDYDATAGRRRRRRNNCATRSKRAVHRQLMSDVPYGVLLSGGLDSSLGRRLRRALRPPPRRGRRPLRSLVAAPAFVRDRPGGLAGPRRRARSPRKRSAPCTTASPTRFEEGLDALPDVIRHIETYDVTTIRASTPMYLLARRIKAMGVKMVLSGEGADEIFGGYLYFHKAPDAREFHDETVRKLDALHQLRLPAREQGDDGLGRGGARAVPRPGVPRRGDGDGCAGEDGARARRRSRASRRRCCARRSPATCRTRSCGGRRNSSATASAMAGSTG